MFLAVVPFDASQVASSDTMEMRRACAGVDDEVWRLLMVDRYKRHCYAITTTSRR